MFTEDNSGFINFPRDDSRHFTSKNVGKTLVYLIAFENKKINNKDISNVYIEMPGLFSSDDVLNRPEVDYSLSIDGLFDSQKENDAYDRYYFPNINSESELIKSKSIELISSICIGWANVTYEFKNQNKFWTATFQDLTNEGGRLYYSMKKLHNDKEIRILTFNHI